MPLSPSIGEHKWHLISLYAALFSLISVKAVTVQALPGVLTVASAGKPELVAEALGAWTAFSATIEFASLPAIGAWSDAVGRKPVMLLLAGMSLLFRILVVCVPCKATVIASRLVVSSLVNGYILLVAASTADLFRRDSAVLAGFEGKTAATWGLAYAVGMVIGGRVFATGITRVTLRTAYMLSSGLALLSLLFTTVGVRETLQPKARQGFTLRGLSPFGFLRLFRRGKLLCSLACILGLQALHDGEGDMWQVHAKATPYLPHFSPISPLYLPYISGQVFSEATRGWGAQQNALYGAAVGVATTCCGVLTGFSVRQLGNRLHTVVWTLATAISTLMFTSPSTRVAFASVPFGCAEDTMQAAANARLVQVGAAQGMPRGQLAADYGNLVAVVRVVGLYFFGKLCSVGMGTGLPQLPYWICAALQLVAVALVFTMPADAWQNDAEGDAEGDADDEDAAGAGD